MAVTDAYADPAEYRARLEHHDSADDAVIAADLALISRVLDKELKRFFTKDATAIARTYYPRARQSGTRSLGWAESENPWLAGGYTRELVVDDMAAAPTAIKIDEDGDGFFTDETALVATDYQLMPLNADKGPEPRPYTSIYIPSWSSKFGFAGDKLVEVTAQWGWPAVPDAIVRYTCELTAILRMESPRATRTVDEVSRVIGVSAAGMSILKALKEAYWRRSSVI